MQIFIAGIMQGSNLGRELHPQDYRERIATIIQQVYPHATIIDPRVLHPNSVDYPPERARVTSLEMARMAGASDLVIAYVPKASMGTAIEIYEAYQHGRLVIAISPLQENWVVQTLSHAVLPNIEAFEE
ncbi:MAG: hypothetical protein J7M34_14285 [Anaerolineae bacterium]|nr:hypothetical protein [Anaerolineae bacterium]